MQFLKQNFVKYGLIMTGIISLCLVWMEVSGQNQSFDKSPLFPATMMLASVMVWYLGIRAKKKMLKEKMMFKQGLIEGVKIGLVYGITSPFIFLFYYLVVNPEIISSVRDVYQLTTASNTTIILTDLSLTFVTDVVMGTLLGAVISFFLKSKKK